MSLSVSFPNIISHDGILGEMAGCGPQNLKWFTMIPGIRKSRKIGIDLDDHFRNPHLETKLPQRMLYGRHKFNEFHFLSDYMVRLPQEIEN
jgi:hypothetical protein